MLLSAYRAYEEDEKRVWYFYNLSEAKYDAWKTEYDRDHVILDQYLEDYDKKEEESSGP